MNQKSTATFYAILAAALYAINIPVSKLLLHHVEPTMMAAFLYLGAGIGVFFWEKARKSLGIENHKMLLTRKELPYTVVMVVQ